MKIKHLMEDRKDYSAIIENPFFKKYILSTINKDIFNGAKNFSIKAQEERSLRNDRSLMSTLSTDVFKHTKRILLHGSNHGQYKTGEVYSLTHRSGPRDSNATIHHIANEISEDKFGEYIRNLLFVSRDMSVVTDYAYTYMDIYVILPIDEPTFYYSDVYHDFFVDYLDHGYAVRNLISDINNTIPLIISDNEENIKKIAEESEMKDSRTLYKIAQHSIKKFLESKSEPMFNTLTSQGSLETLVDELKETVSDHIVYTSEQEGTNKMSSKHVSKLDKIVSSMVDQYVNNMKKASYNFVDDYMKTVKVTKNFDEVDMDSEIMMDCDQFTVIEMIDFIEIIQQVYNKSS